MAGMSRLLLFMLGLSVFTQQADAQHAEAQQSYIYISNAARSATETNPTLAPGSLVSLTIYPPIDLEKPYSLRIEDSVGVSRQLLNIRSKGTVTDTQLEAQIPAAVRLGNARVVLNHDGKVQSAPVRIVEASFEVFTIPNTKLIANVQNYSPSGESGQNGLIYPARPGDYLTFWGTGMGTDVSKPVHVVIGGKRAKVIWAGKAPANPGVDQVNVQLEDHISWQQSCYVPVRISAGEQNSKVTTIAIANEGLCPHPFDLTVDERNTLDFGGAIPFVSVELMRRLGKANTGRIIFDNPSVTDRMTWKEEIYAKFGSATAEAVAVRAASLEIPGSCRLQEEYPNLHQGFSDSSLDVGTALAIQGTDNTVDVPSAIQTQSPYSNFLVKPGGQTDILLLPSPLFKEGQWTLSALGGTDVMPFQQEIQIVPAPVPTNHIQFKFMSNPTAQLPIRWNPAGYGPDDQINIRVGKLSCYARAKDGEFTIPSTEMRKANLPNGVLYESLFINVVQPSQGFTIPLVEGGFMRGSFTDTTSLPVPFMTR